METDADVGAAEVGEDGGTAGEKFHVDGGVDVEPSDL